MDSQLQQEREVNGGTPFAEASGSGAAELLAEADDIIFRAIAIADGWDWAVEWREKYRAYRERQNTKLTR